jgi:hypothetical protein
MIHTSVFHSFFRPLAIAVLAWMVVAALGVAAAVLSQPASDPAARAARDKSAKAALVTSVGPRQSSPVAL